MCTDEPVVLASVVNGIAAVDQGQPGFESCGGAPTLDEAGLLSGNFGGPAGAALLGAIESWAGGDTTGMQGWVCGGQVPCQNCTEFQDRVVVWLPAAAAAVVMDFTHGYDS